MKMRNLARMACIVIALMLAVGMIGCGEGDTAATPANDTASDGAAEGAASADAGTEDGDTSVVFDDAPDIEGYEITDESESPSERTIYLVADATEEEALTAFSDWAAANGWTPYEAELPNIDLVFEKPDRVYPMKIGVFPQPSSGGVEVLVIMPAHGEKLGDW